MLREPPLKVFRKNISIRDMVSISCSYEKSAKIIKETVPQINELYTLFDFNKVFNTLGDSKLIRECINHFKPKTVILQSTLFENLPSDLLGSFSLFTPQKLIIGIKGFDQQFLITRFRAHELRFEYPKSWNNFDKSALALNSILQSVIDLESLELFNCSIDDFTVTAFGHLCLLNLTLNNVNLQCGETNTFVEYLTRQTFMKNLVLRYDENLLTEFHPFFSRLVNNIHELRLESLEISVSNNFFEIDNIISIQSLKSVQININGETSFQTINYIGQIISARPDIQFKIHGFSPIQPNDEHSFIEYFNRLPNAIGSWGPGCQ